MDGLLRVAGGCWDDDITSDEMDHSLKFPTFCTSKLLVHHTAQSTVIHSFSGPMTSGLVSTNTEKSKRNRRFEVPGLVNIHKLLKICLF